jgi:hypothetical protein
MTLFTMNAIFTALGVLAFPGAQCVPGGSAAQTSGCFFGSFSLQTDPAASGANLPQLIDGTFCTVVTGNGLVGNCTINGAVAGLVGSLAIGYIFGNWVFAAGVVSLFYSTVVSFPSFWFRIAGNSPFMTAVFYVFMGLFAFYYVLEMVKEVSGRYTMST